MDQVTVGDTVVRVVRADITGLAVDAIVNAANEELVHGGGVAAAIAAAGAPDVDAESRRWVRDHGPLRSGVAAVTSAGSMPAKFVIHVAGPVYRRGAPNEVILARAVRAALDAAATTGARSIAFPAISAGIYGYPTAEATTVIAAEVAAWLDEHPGDLYEVILVGYGEGIADDFRRALDALDRPPS